MKRFSPQAGGLALPVAQEVELRAADFGLAQYLDLLHVFAEEWERALYATPCEPVRRTV